MTADDREKEVEIHKTKYCATCELRELNYKRAYLRLFNRVCDAIQSNVTAMLEEALLEAERICTSDDGDDNSEN